MAQKILTTKSPDETRDLGKKIAKTLKGGEVLCLYGELGAGKTTFTQGLAEGLGINKRIISPTFILMRQYPISLPRALARGDAQMLYHLDCYRLENEKDARALGLKEIMDNKNNIVIIEWPEKIKKILPEKKLDIEFFQLGDDNRKIIIK